MSVIRIESVAEPFASEPDIAVTASRLIAAAEYMSALPPLEGVVQEIGAPLLLLVLDGLADLGVANLARNRFANASTADEYRTILTAALDQVEHSPMPAGEWAPLIESLGEDLLSALLGISETSLRRYAAGVRHTPDPVAARLHFLALVVADLSGGYNDYGIRRWFDRPRTVLNGQSPRELFGVGFDPYGHDAARLRELAAGLLGAGAT